MATINALAYGALAVFLSDRYETKAWKASRWELGLETTTRLAGAVTDASNIPAASTVKGVVQLGTTALSKWFNAKPQQLLKVVYSVARKFELQVLREAEEGHLRGRWGDVKTHAQGGVVFTQTQWMSTSTQRP